MTRSSAKINITAGNARKNLVWNVFSILLLVGMAMSALGFTNIFFDPYSSLNPFPPPTMPAVLELPTATPTLRQLPPTWTPTATATRTPTLAPPSPVVADAVEVTPGAFSTPLPEETEPPNRYAFVVQGEVKAIDGTIFRPEHGCAWMGIAGQAFDMQNRPATGITVQVGGNLGKKYIDLISLTGTALWYGQAGYEVFLSDALEPSQNSLWVRLLDQSGLPLSAKVYFSTSIECKSNLVVINFKQVR
jgi:hypothetical protein